MEGGRAVCHPYLPCGDESSSTSVLWALTQGYGKELFGSSDVVRRRILMFTGRRIPMFKGLDPIGRRSAEEADDSADPTGCRISFLERPPLLTGLGTDRASGSRREDA